MANSSTSVNASMNASGQAQGVAFTAASMNPYRTRYATLADAGAIDNVVREVFGSSAPPSSAARDMRRRNTTYILVTRGTNGHVEDMNGAESGADGISGRLRSLFSSSFGRLAHERSIGNIAGLVGIWTAVDQAHIVVIASRPNERGKGVGELLLLATITEALKIGALNATLEVRKSNAVARSLYRKYGFSDVGIRRKYYHDNREDAVIMSTPSFSNLEYRRSLRSRCLAYFSTRGKAGLHIDPLQYLSLPEKV